jgi:chaperonin GroEL (HSP60 family)
MTYLLHPLQQQAKHAQDPLKNAYWGIDGETGKLADMRELGVWDAYSVRAQVIKSAVEVWVARASERARERVCVC